MIILIIKGLSYYINIFFRSAQFLQVNDLEAQNVTLFLAEQKIIRDTLKNRLMSVNGYEDLFIEIINNSAYMYENKVYLLPEEKHMHVIVKKCYIVYAFIRS